MAVYNVSYIQNQRELHFAMTLVLFSLKKSFVAQNGLAFRNMILFILCQISRRFQRTLDSAFGQVLLQRKCYPLVVQISRIISGFPVNMHYSFIWLLVKRANLYFSSNDSQPDKSHLNVTVSLSISLIEWYSKQQTLYIVSQC